MESQVGQKIPGANPLELAGVFFDTLDLLSRRRVDWPRLGLDLAEERFYFPFPLEKNEERKKKNGNVILIRSVEYQVGRTKLPVAGLLRSAAVETVLWCDQTKGTEKDNFFVL